MNEKMIYEYSKTGRKAWSIDNETLAVEEGIIDQYLPSSLQRQNIGLPEVSEPEIVRHFTRLASLNYGVDTGFYPLGSCTMKYNPKINELLAGNASFTQTHPLQSYDSVQGSLQLMYELKQMLAEITGMDSITLLPAAGAHGELTGLMVAKKYFNDIGQGKQRSKMIIPDSAHGTNPASAAMVGFETVEVKSRQCGQIDIEHLKTLISPEIAGIMLTNPNTAGVFEADIKETASLLHDNGSILYYDGANMNALLGQARPGDMGFDIIHLNLHKTFSTPHGGGGPGSAPVGVKAFLSPYLPMPDVIKNDYGYSLLEDSDKSIGRIRLSGANFMVLLKTYAWILSMGPDGLKKVSQYAVLNANYIREKLSIAYSESVKCICMHECVLSASSLLQYGVKAKDVSKRIIDYGMHPPTNYFPLIIPEALMIEPTESESKETLDQFIEVMIKIAEEAKTNPELLLEAPHHTPVGRPDEVKAAKDLDVAYRVL
jgi:glycine dehydrogenase subunit 2